MGLSLQQQAILRFQAERGELRVLRGRGEIATQGSVPLCRES